MTATMPGRVYGKPPVGPTLASDHEARTTFAAIAAAANPPAEVVDAVELDTRWPLEKALANAGWMNALRTMNALPQPEPDAEFDPRVCAFCGNDKGGPLCPHTPGHDVFRISESTPVVVFKAPARLDQASPAEIVARINASVTR